MNGLIKIGSSAEWQSLLAGTNVVVADFYADWCGPCKMIAPHFERLASEHSRPKKMAFAKIDVDSQSAISQSYGVSAMPTFKIFHAGTCIETIKGANPSALSAAVAKAVQLSGTGGAAAGDVFKTPGRTLGGGAAPARRAAPMSWDMGGLLKTLLAFVGLYLVSLFSVDARKGAELSWFNVHKKPSQQKKSSGEPANGATRPTQKPAFKTLADLRSE